MVMASLVKLVNAIARSANKENSLTIRGSYQERTPTVHRAENAKVATTAQRTVLDATHATKDHGFEWNARHMDVGSSVTLA